MKNNEYILILPSWYSHKDDSLDGNFVRDQALALAKYSNYRVVVLLFSEDKRDWVFDSSLDYIVINYKNFIPARFGNIFLNIKKKWMLYIINKRVNDYIIGRNSKPKHIIVQSVLNNAFIHNSIVNNLKVPYSIIEHYVVFDKVEDYIYKPYSNITEVKKFVKQASNRFGVSKFYCNIYEKYFGAKFDVLYNPINESFFETPCVLKKNDIFTFINIGGGSDNRKRPYFIIDALSKAFDEKIKLVFVAKDEIKSSLVDYAQSINCKHEIVFYPIQTVNEIINLLDQSHILISASTHESFGLTIIEAGARALPVVCSKSGGPNELVIDKTGILFEVDNLEDFVKSLVKIKNNYKLYNQDDIKGYSKLFSFENYALNLSNNIQ